MPFEDQPALAAHETADPHVQERVEAQRPLAHGPKAGPDHRAGPEQADRVGHWILEAEHHRHLLDDT